MGSFSVRCREPSRHDEQIRRQLDLVVGCSGKGAVGWPVRRRRNHRTPHGCWSSKERAVFVDVFSLHFHVQA